MATEATSMTTKQAANKAITEMRVPTARKIVTIETIAKITTATASGKRDGDGCSAKRRHIDEREINGSDDAETSGKKGMTGNGIMRHGEGLMRRWSNLQ